MRVCRVPLLIVVILNSSNKPFTTASNAQVSSDTVKSNTLAPRNVGGHHGDMAKVGAENEERMMDGNKAVEEIAERLGNVRFNDGVDVLANKEVEKAIILKSENAAGRAGDTEADMTPTVKGPTAKKESKYLLPKKIAMKRSEKGKNAMKKFGKGKYAMKKFGKGKYAMKKFGKGKNAMKKFIPRIDDID